MHVTLIYREKIDTYDTKADGLAAMTHACVEVRRERASSMLVLWSNLTYSEAYRLGDDAEKVRARKEEGTPEPLIILTSGDLWDGEDLPDDIQGLLGLAGKHLGLMRCDIDGETIFEAEADEQEDYGYGLPPQPHG